MYLFLLSKVTFFSKEVICSVWHPCVKKISVSFSDSERPYWSLTKNHESSTDNFFFRVGVGVGVTQNILYPLVDVKVYYLPFSWEGHSFICGDNRARHDKKCTSVRAGLGCDMPDSIFGASIQSLNHQGDVLLEKKKSFIMLLRWRSTLSS